MSFDSVDYRNAKPVSDSVFRTYQGLYSYDRTPLDAKIKSEDDSSPYWRKQRISFKAAYNNERVIAFLFLPKKVSPPYQTVLHFPGADATTFHTFMDLHLFNVDFLMKSGRAVMFPFTRVPSRESPTRLLPARAKNAMRPSSAPRICAGRWTTWKLVQTSTMTGSLFTDSVGWHERRDLGGA